ncbi:MULTISPECIES: hypothetical protein [Streptomyces]|uniref:N-acetyltransferase domain-containing protein n=1 Tax=Streptomyces venezuelae TaxID=54571 RepID=A0A5P2BDQ3_STRVZ|nr:MULTISPECIES: hypothetical protein [Streptomyces]NDZ98291.1 hypothetical protein [Streptomyces sp. SID10116]MYY84984.1 hypothetical protein [Streptomyces sp. SID335]MYZ12332.1 hypothetical protein [Streptomyces sp. SID337]NDZ85935.1 hypothetical protein [Streptomyces sp. SID10115]NEB47285.1 hypothetical protein [Streptomyces sp. SID339]
MAEMFLRRLSRWQAEGQREAVADLYTETSGAETGGGASGVRADFLRRFEHDVQQTDFDMVVAHVAGNLVGCLYGYRADRGGEWWEAFRHVLSPAVVEQTSSGRVFLLSEVMVAPAERGSDVAYRLRTLLLTRHTPDVVVAVIRPDDDQGREVLQSWDWTKLGEFAPRQEGWLRPPSPLP